MAELFSECYKNDTRYCPEAKSWFTYSEGAWRKDTGSLLVAEKIKEFCRLMLSTAARSPMKNGVLST